MLDGGELKTLQFMVISFPTTAAYSWLFSVSISGAISKGKRKELTQMPKKIQIITGSGNTAQFY